MTKMRFGLVSGAMALLGVSAALAAAPDPNCLAQARSQKQSCTTTCKTAFDQAKILCRNIDPTCANDCESREATCTAPFLSTLNPCLDTCQSQLQSDKQACPASSDPTHTDCINAAQLTAFNCREACRNDATVSAGLKGCRKDYYSCLQRCPAP